MATRHGEHGTPLYRRWKAMRQRVQGKYRDLGIGLDPEWDDYRRFRDWAINAGFREDLTLDRIDNTGDYTPSNCRWVTTAVQNKNKRPADEQGSRNRRIFRRDWPVIVMRRAGGEGVGDIAASYGVSEARIYNILSSTK